MNNPSNPFNPNSIVTSTLFAGRGQQTLSVLKKLSNVREGQHASFILHGERGIGKTALAKLIRHISSSKSSELFNLNFAISYYSVEKGQSLKTVMESLLNNITDVLPDSSLKKLSDRLGGLFKKGKFSFGAFGMNLNVDKREVREQKQFFKDQIVSSLTNLVQSSVGKDDDYKFDGILIAIDEIHNIQDLEGAGQIFRSIINTLVDVNEKGFFSFLLIGYSDSIDKFFKGDPSARRSFDLLHLDVMPDDEAKELLTKGFNEIKDLKYDMPSLDKYINVAGGYPHSLQILGHQLIEIDNDNNISNEDWNQAIVNSAKELQSKDFSDLYSFAGKPTLREEIMNHLALANGVAITKTSLGKSLGKNIYQKNALPQLIQTGAVKEDVNSGKLSLHSEFFKSAIRFHLKTLEKN